MECCCIFSYLNLLNSIFKWNISFFLDIAYIYCSCFSFSSSYINVNSIIFTYIYISCTAQYPTFRRCKQICMECCIGLSDLNFLNSIFKRNICLFFNIAYIYCSIFRDFSHFDIYSVTCSHIHITSITNLIVFWQNESICMECCIIFSYLNL